MKPIRIQRKRVSGWKKPKDAINCTRPSVYGNPFSVEKYGLDKAIEYFERLLTECNSIYDMPFDAQEDAFNAPIIAEYDSRKDVDSVTDMIRKDLGGKDLMCFCSLKAKCHVDILLRIANE